MQNVSCDYRKLQKGTSHRNMSMFRLLFIGLLIYFTSCEDKVNYSERSNFEDTSLKILSTGVPDLEAGVQLNALSKKYGFKYCSVGCIVSQSLSDSIQNENAKTYKILELRYGKKWRAKLSDEIENLNSIKNEFSDLIASKIPKDSNFYFLISACNKKNIYEVKAYKPDTLNDYRLIVYHRLTIDIKRRSIIQAAKTFEKL